MFLATSSSRPANPSTHRTRQVSCTCCTWLDRHPDRQTALQPAPDRYDVLPFTPRSIIKLTNPVSYLTFYTWVPVLYPDLYPFRLNPASENCLICLPILPPAYASVSIQTDNKSICTSHQTSHSRCTCSVLRLLTNTYIIHCTQLTFIFITIFITVVKVRPFRWWCCVWCCILLLTLCFHYFTSSP